MEHEKQRRRRDLTDDGRPRRAPDAQLRHRAEAVDHNRVEHDIDDRARDLADGRVQRTPRCLEQLLEQREKDNAERECAADEQVVVRHADDLRVRCLRRDVRPCPHQTEQQTDEINDRAEEQTVPGDLRRLFTVSLPERACEQRVHAHARSDSERHHEHLHRKGQCHRVERRLASLAHISDERAVHDVVHRLKRHGQDHRQSHPHHQPVYRHLFHSVVFRHFFEFLLLFAQKERAAPRKPDLRGMLHAQKTKNKTSRTKTGFTQLCYSFTL